MPSLKGWLKRPVLTYAYESALRRAIDDHATPLSAHLAQLVFRAVPDTGDSRRGAVSASKPSMERSRRGKRKYRFSGRKVDQINCSLLTFLPLLEGDLNPILGFCFPLLQGGIVRAHEQRETSAWACLGRQKISSKSASS